MVIAGLFKAREVNLMTRMKKLLIGATVLFVLIVGAGIYISQQSMEFKKYHEHIVHEFMPELTASWNLADVESKVSPEFLEQAASEEGQAYLQQFRVLGPVQSIAEIAMGKYFSGSDGTLGEFIFKARFAPAEVLVKLTLHEKDGEVWVQGITINSLDAEGKQTDFALATPE